VHLFFRPNGLPVNCIPLGGNRWRVVMPNAGERGGAPPSFEEIQQLVAQRAPWPMTLSDPTWLSCFRCHLRVTTAYRRGRVLLAGDAAHVHSPAGGQGMNTGILDADNLAWKLALVADRRASAALLETYEQERLPVAAGVLNFTDSMVRLMTLRHPVKRAVRNTLVPVVCSAPAVRKRISGRLSQMSTTYVPGPLVRTDDLSRGPKPGQRCPDVEVRTPAGPVRLHHLLRAGQHVLVVSTGGAGTARAASELRAYSGLVRVVDADLGPGFTLLRPDGVVAVRGTRLEMSRIEAYLRELFGVDPSRSAAPDVFDEAAGGAQSCEPGVGVLG
jgi:4,5-epoxidase